jgi:hypothetical protein
MQFPATEANTQSFSIIIGKSEPENKRTDIGKYSSE